MNLTCKTVLFLGMACCSSLFAQPSKADIQAMKRGVLQALPRVEGWCSSEKATAMMDLIIQENPEVCVEIGVFGGSSILPTASALKLNQKGKVYAIDPWKNEECTNNYEQNNPNYTWWNKVDLNYVFASYKNLLKRHGLQNHVITLQMTSEQALGYVPESIDILHIDGNHSEASSTFDMEHYFPLVKVGGYVWFDDLHWGTTLNAYQEMIEFCEVIKTVDKGNCVLLKKVRE